MEIVPQKYCAKCGKPKTLSNFYSRPDAPDGYRSDCKACTGQTQKAYQQRNKSRELITIPAFRYCKQCDEYKPSDEFARDAGAADGLFSRCKVCTHVWSRKYRTTHRDHVLRLQRASKERTNRHIYEYNRKWRLSHPAEMSAYFRDYRRRHPEKYLKYGRSWRLRNRAAGVRYAHAYKARKKHNGGTYTVAEWLMLCEQYDHRCLACGKQEPEIKLTVDHVVPVSHSGPNVIGNIQPLCGPCNSSKGARHIDYRPVVSEV